MIICITVSAIVDLFRSGGNDRFRSSLIVEKSAGD
jgi:hypothetical protein